LFFWVYSFRSSVVSICWVFISRAAEDFKEDSR
jgi:hypothetical protein